jgi:hypothetical protein
MHSMLCTLDSELSTVNSERGLPILALHLISPLECTLTKNAPATPLESVVTKRLHLKSFRIRSYKKVAVGGHRQLRLRFALGSHTGSAMILPEHEYR